MIIPAKYNYLTKLKAPKVILEALKWYGTTEIPGKVNNLKIMQWAKELGLTSAYSNDDIPWCGLFAAKVVATCGYQAVNNPLWALNWVKFGTAQKSAALGDVLVFKRPTGGHVGFYVAEDATCYHVLGGNQSDMVNITRVEKSRCVAIRRCPWKIGQPAEVKKYVLAANGVISKNEA